MSLEFPFGESAEPAIREPLTIIGLRPRTELSSSEPVFDAVVSMLRLVPGTELTMQVGLGMCDGDGPSHLSVRIDSDVPELPEELAVVLDEDVVTERRAAPRGPFRHVWRARPAAAGLGFTPAGARSRSWNTETSVSLRDRARLWQALGQWIGGCLEVAVAAVDDQWFMMSVGLLGDTVPPLGLLGALRDNFPGLTFAPGEDGEPSFRCDETEVRVGLLLPVGQDAPAGFLAGPPAGLPITETTKSRRREAAAGMRIGAARADTGRRVDVTLADAELLRHMHVVGATGTGKSTLLAGMVHQLAHSGHGALVLDPHGTLVDRIVAELPAEAADRCMVVRADDLENPVPINPLAAGDEVGLATAIADIGDMFYELFDPGHTGVVGPRFVDRVAHALRGLVALRGSRATLLDVPLILDDKYMRAALLKAMTDPRELVWWRNDVVGQKSTEYGELVAWVNCKFEAFSASPALRAILGSGEDAYDPAGAMEDGRIILVDLAKGQIGQAASRLLGYLLINRFWVAAMNRTTTRRFHVIVDEAHSVMAGSLVNMLSEGRKFGISVTAAHQYLGQLQPDVAEALVGNVGTSVVFRANGPHVRAHVDAMGGQVEAATLANLPMFHAVVTRNAADGVTSRPFTMTVSPRPQTCVPAGIDQVLRTTRRFVGDVDLTPLDPDQYDPLKRAVPMEPPTHPREPEGAVMRSAVGEELPVPGQGAVQGQTSASSSFVDEWLAKRAAAAADRAAACAEEAVRDEEGTEQL